jgi:hypothetical protein
MTKGTPFLYVLLALRVCIVSAQGLTQYVPSTTACVELNQTVISQVANGQAAAAEAALSKALASGADRAQDPCGGFILNNMARDVLHLRSRTSGTLYGFAGVADWRVSQHSDAIREIAANRRCNTARRNAAHQF